MDLSCPTDAGSRPGCGAIIAMLEAAAGWRAYSVGKPMMRAARKRLGLRTDQTITVGDTMETDIRGGLELGFRTTLVLTGSTSRENVSLHPFRPTQGVESVGEVNLEHLASRTGRV